MMVLQRLMKTCENQNHMTDFRISWIDNTQLEFPTESKWHIKALWSFFGF